MATIENLVTGFLNAVSLVANFILEKISYLGINYPTWFFTVLFLFIAVLIIFIGTKLSNKILKIILIILGILLIIGTSYGILSKF